VLRGGWVLHFGVFLERRRLRIRLAPRRVTQWQNYYRNFMHGAFAAARKHPGEKEEAQEDEADKKVVAMFLNQGIQKLGRTRDIDHRVFHTNPSVFFWFIPKPAHKKVSNFHAKTKLVMNMHLGSDIRN
jgi:hypothetical protein